MTGRTGWLCAPALVACSVTAVLHAQEEPNIVAHSASADEPGSGQLDFQTDAFTGRFSTAVQIKVPPGRQGSQPHLALSYSSSNGNGWLGVGWTLHPGYVQRRVDDGVPVRWSNPAADPDHAYDDAKGFEFSLNGVASELVLIDAAQNVWAAKVEGPFIRFRFDTAAGHWEATDKSGNTYLFGDTADSRMEHPDWGASPQDEKTYRWSLSRTETANGTFTTYRYLIDAAPYNAQYLQEIRYNGLAGTVTREPTHRVRFVLEDRPAVSLGGVSVSDWPFGYRSGYRIQTRKRLASIDVEMRINQVGDPDLFDLPVRRYKITYEPLGSPSTHRTRLASVQEFAVNLGGSDGPALPATSFTYQDQQLQFDPIQEWGTIIDHPDLACNESERRYWRAISATGIKDCAGQAGATHLALLDVDQDGFPDRAMVDANSTTGYDRLVVQFNDGLTFGPVGGPGFDGGLCEIPINNGGGEFQTVGGNSARFNSIPSASQTNSFHDILTLDFDGDGYFDRVINPDVPPTTSPNHSKLRVQKSNAGMQFEAVPTDVTDVDNQSTVTERRNSPEFQESYTVPSEILVTTEDYTTHTYAFSTLIDMNGDGKVDRVMRELDGSQAGAPGVYDRLLIQYNSGNAFQPRRAWHLNSGLAGKEWNSPSYSVEGSCNAGCCGGPEINYVENRLLMADMNGDGLPDRVMRKQSAPYDALMIQFNTGTSFEAPIPWAILSQGQTQAAWGCPVSSKKDTRCPPQRRYSTLATLEDLNGDGLLDRLMATPDPDDPGGEKFVVQINYGNGFGPEMDYTGLEVGIGSDLTGDGIPDPIAADAMFAPQYRFGTGALRTRSDIMDMNGDGLVDRVMEEFPADNPTFLVQLAAGPFPDLLSAVSNGIGDPSPGEFTAMVEYAPSTRYDNREELGHANPWQQGTCNLLPIVVQTVSKLITRDGMGNEYHTFYDYAGGYFDRAEREFRGFYRVEQRDDLGTRTVTYFHQGGGVDGSALGEYDDEDAQAKQGRPFRVETWGRVGAQDKLYRVEVMMVVEDDLMDGRHFAQTVQQATLDFEGADSAAEPYRATLTQMTRDPQTGNLTSSVRLGEIDNFVAAAHTYDAVTPGVQRQETEYCYYDPAAFSCDIRDRPRAVLSFDGAGNRLRETRFTYDDRGNVLAEVQLIEPDDMAPAPACDAGFLAGDVTATESFVYDDVTTGSYNLLEATDPVGVVTRYAYDVTYNVFPEITFHDSGGLNYWARTCIDPRSGQPLATRDIKGFWTLVGYDEHFRMTRESVVPLEGGDVSNCGNQWYCCAQTVTGAVVVEERDYSLLGTGSGTTQNWIEVRTVDGRDTDGSSTFHVSRTYLDGLGRQIQTRSEFDFDDPARRWRVTDTEYDERGKVSFQTRAYFTGIDGYMHHGGRPGTRTTFDPIGRPIQIEPPGGDGSLSPTGSSFIAYEDAAAATTRERIWTTVETGPTGRVRKTRHDGFGRAFEIVEVNGPDEYVTTYGYDGRNNLQSIHDHYENPPVEFEHDAMDRRTRTDDPDMGIWDLEYDAAGRLVTQTDARGQVTRYRYDPLGRVTHRDVFESGGTVLEESTEYRYDSATVPAFTVRKGQLFEVAHYDGAGKLLDRTRHSYDSRDREVRRQVFVGKVQRNYGTRLGYDDADRVTRINYPGRVVVNQAYGPHGNLVSIDATISGTTTRVYEATDFDEFDRVTHVVFGNDLETDFNYYANSRRLSSIETAGVQDLRYQYDASSNLARIDDMHHNDADPHDLGMTGMVYDNLHRLTEYRSVSLGQDIEFVYDAIGRIKRNDESGPVIAEDYRYDGSSHLHDQPHAATEANGRAYQYDANGSMTRRDTDAGQQVLDYNARNQLVRVSDPSVVVEFGYDADGMRLWKHNLTTGQRSIWVGSHYEERNGTPLSHVFAGERRICTIEERLRTAEVSVP